MPRSPGASQPDSEVPLLGEGVTRGIVRIGDTVHRPTRPFTASVQAFLAYVRERGFRDAPEPLGYDNLGREVLSYVPGVAAFADAHGMTMEQRVQLVPLAILRARNTQLTARAAAQADPVLRRFWEEGVKDRLPRAEQWWADHADSVAAAVTR